MTHEYKLYANNECVETVTFGDENRTFMTDNPNCEGSPKNCPNCGAPIIGDSCEYCGTIFVDRKASEIKKANQLYSDAIARLSMYELNQQAYDLRSVMLQAMTSTQNGLQGMYWGDAMAQQTPPDELEKFERQNMLAATNVHPYHKEPEPTKKKKRTIIEFLKGL